MVYWVGNTMKILTVCHGMGLGGTERVAQTFSIGYQKAKHHVAVLNWGVSGPRQKILESLGIPVFTANNNLTSALADANDFKPDIIHIHRRGWRNDRETYVLQQLHNSKRRVLEQNVFGSVDYSPAADLIDVHFQISRWCMWRWRRYLGAKSLSTPGVIVPNPINPIDFEPVSNKEIEAFLKRYNIGRDAYICGRVGQPLEGKWHPETLIAFADLARKEHRAVLLLIGMPESLRKTLKSLPSDIQQRILQLPLTESDKDLRNFYSSIDCFIHAARQGESFGLVLAEAMLCGCPVITVSQPHKDNSQVEVVGHMRGGIVAGSMKKLSDAVIRLWSDEELRQTIRRNARAHVIQRYDITKVVATTLQVAEIASSAGDRKTLIRLLNEARNLQTAVANKEIYSLYHNTLGRPSPVDILRMNVLHTPVFNRTKSFLRRMIRRD